MTCRRRSCSWTTGTRSGARDFARRFERDVEAIAEGSKLTWFALWRREFKVPLCDPRARRVTYEQARLELETLWAQARAEDEESGRGTDGKTNEEWFREQDEVMRQRRAAREQAAAEAGAKFERSDLPTTAEGNTSKEAALQRLKALKGIIPDPSRVWSTDPHAKWDTVDFTSDTED